MDCYPASIGAQDAPAGSRHAGDWSEPPHPRRDQALRHDRAAGGDWCRTRRPRPRSRWPTYCKPGVTSVIVGARTDDQLADNLAAADLQLADDELARLDAVSAMPLLYPPLAPGQHGIGPASARRAVAAPATFASLADGTRRAGSHLSGTPDQAVGPGDQVIVRGSAYAAVSREPLALLRGARIRPWLCHPDPTSHPTEALRDPRKPPTKPLRDCRDAGSRRDFARTSSGSGPAPAPGRPPCQKRRPSAASTQPGIVGRRPTWRGFATRRARCLAIGPPAGRSGRDVPQGGSPTARGARGWPGSPERGNFAPSTRRRLWLR